MRKTDRFGITIVVALAALAVLAPRGAQAQTVIDIGNASGIGGADVLIQVGLMTGTAVAGTENEIAFQAEAQIAFDGVGEPECIVNGDIGKSGFFAFQPTGCTPGDDCTSMKAIIIGIFESTQEECDDDPANCYNLDPIPDGSVLYDCNVNLAAAADGTFPLTCANPDASDPDGVPLPTTCTDGEVTIEGGISCVGDCNGNGSVSLGEVQTSLDIFFDESLYDQCPAADANMNGAVSLGEVQTSLDNFFLDCPE